MIQTWKESDLMNCLKCSNFWKTDIDEAICNKCGTQKARTRKMSECEISNCGYYWQEEGEPYPSCHYNDPWPAPCEYDEEEEDED